MTGQRRRPRRSPTPSARFSRRSRRAAPPAAAIGVAGLRGLNDGLVPAPPAAGGGRGGGPVGAGGAPAFDGPLFTWSGARGTTQWAQYTFPDDQEISQVDVFWVRPPESWRLSIRTAVSGKKSRPAVPTACQSGAFTSVEFAARQDHGDAASKRGWQPTRRSASPNGASAATRKIVPAADLKVSQSFALNGEALDWTVTLQNTGRARRRDRRSRRAVQLRRADRRPRRHLHEEAAAPRVCRRPRFLRLLAAQQRRRPVPGHDADGADRSSSTTTAPVGWGPAGSGPSLPTSTPRRRRAAAAAQAAATGACRSRAPTIAGRRHDHLLLPVPVGEGFRRRARRPLQGGQVRHVGCPRHGRPDRPAGDVLAAHDPEDRRDRTGAPGTTRSTDRERLPDTRSIASASPASARTCCASSHGNGEWASLEFFVTEPLETVIKKRSSFLVTHHQHTDPSKWYVGMYSDWDQKNEVLRSPEDRDGLSAWLTDANDDAGNARPAFIASKNVFFPDQKEIESLELYISKYLWGGMQMTEQGKVSVRRSTASRTSRPTAPAPTPAATARRTSGASTTIRTS